MSLSLSLSLSLSVRAVSVDVSDHVLPQSLIFHSFKLDIQSTILLPRLLLASTFPPKFPVLLFLLLPTINLCKGFKKVKKSVRVKPILLICFFNTALLELNYVSEKMALTVSQTCFL